MRARVKTAAQWRGEVPAYDRACAHADALRKHWSGHLIVAHLDPETLVVSCRIRVVPARLPAVQEVLGGVRFVAQQHPVQGTVHYYRGTAADLELLAHRFGGVR